MHYSVRNLDTDEEHEFKNIPALLKFINANRKDKSKRNLGAKKFKSVMAGNGVFENHFKIVKITGRRSGKKAAKPVNLPAPAPASLPTPPMSDKPLPFRTRRSQKAKKDKAPAVETALQAEDTDVVMSEPASAPIEKLTKGSSDPEGVKENPVLQPQVDKKRKISPRQARNMKIGRAKSKMKAFLNRRMDAKGGFDLNVVKANLRALLRELLGMPSEDVAKMVLMVAREMNTSMLGVLQRVAGSQSHPAARDQSGVRTTDDIPIPPLPDLGSLAYQPPSPPSDTSSIADLRERYERDFLDTPQAPPTSPVWAGVMAELTERLSPSAPETEEMAQDTPAAENYGAAREEVRQVLDRLIVNVMNANVDARVLQTPMPKEGSLGTPSSQTPLSQSDIQQGLQTLERNKEMHKQLMEQIRSAEKAAQDIQTRSFDDVLKELNAASTSPVSQATEKTLQRSEGLLAQIRESASKRDPQRAAELGELAETTPTGATDTPMSRMEAAMSARRRIITGDEEEDDDDDTSGIFTDEEGEAAADTPEIVTPPPQPPQPQLPTGPVAQVNFVVDMIKNVTSRPMPGQDDKKVKRAAAYLNDGKRVAEIVAAIQEGIQSRASRTSGETVTSNFWSKMPSSEVETNIGIPRRGKLTQGFKAYIRANKDKFDAAFPDKFAGVMRYGSGPGDDDAMADVVANPTSGEVMAVTGDATENEIDPELQPQIEHSLNAYNISQLGENSPEQYYLLRSRMATPMELTAFAPMVREFALNLLVKPGAKAKVNNMLREVASQNASESSFYVKYLNHLLFFLLEHKVKLPANELDEIEADLGNQYGAFFGQRSEARDNAIVSHIRMVVNEGTEMQVDTEPEIQEQILHGSGALDFLKEWEKGLSTIVRSTTGQEIEKEVVAMQRMSRSRRRGHVLFDTNGSNVVRQGHYAPFKTPIDPSLRRPELSFQSPPSYTKRTPRIATRNVGGPKRVQVPVATMTSIGDERMPLEIPSQHPSGRPWASSKEQEDWYRNKAAAQDLRKSRGSETTKNYREIANIANRGLNQMQGSGAVQQSGLRRRRGIALYAEEENERQAHKRLRKAFTLSMYNEK